MGTRILIVEDEAILGLELKEDLCAMGYEVPEIVTDGDRVLRAVAAHKPDLILMDIKLYGFRDGIEAAGQVRGFFETPILYLSSYPEAEVANRIRRTSQAAYLEKPCSPEVLQRAIEEALSRKSAGPSN